MSAEYPPPLRVIRARVPVRHGHHMFADAHRLAGALAGLAS